jgi:uncharacterized membrane protein YoaK (UPF0700 family)
MSTRRVILVGGCGLAFGAAFANIGVVLHTGTSVSHLTGDLVRLTVDLLDAAPGAVAGLARVAVAMCAFFLGATLSGYIVHHPDLDFARPYGRTVTVIGLIFLAASWGIPRAPVAGIALAAFGCGLQNALASRYRGVILRTTHLTGLITDLGIGLGMRLRGFDIPVWKLLVPVALIASFFLGGLFGAGVFFFSMYDPVFVAGLAYCAAGAGWSLRRRLQARAARGKSD